MKNSISTKRMWILAAILFSCYSLVWLVPEPGEMRPSLLKETLPDSLNGWHGKSVQVGPRERKILAKDTDFVRKNYIDRSLDGHLGVEVSLVFSGKDMNNSIHRPEVCLRSQGWNFLIEKFVTLDVDIGGFKKIPFKVILCEKPLYNDKEPRLDKNGKHIVMRRIQYYTFYGHTNIVAGHFERVTEDMKDRVFKGYDQRWAYATFSSIVTQKFVDDGTWDVDQKAYNDVATTKVLEDFIKELMKVGLEDHNKD